MKNMFEWHDSLHSKFNSGLSTEISMNQNCDFDGLSDATDQVAPTNNFSKKSSSIPWNLIIVIAGVFLAGYVFYIIPPKNYNRPSYFKRIRAAKKISP